MFRGRILSATVVLCTVGTIASAQPAANLFNPSFAGGGNERSGLVKGTPRPIEWKGDDRGDDDRSEHGNFDRSSTVRVDFGRDNWNRHREPAPRRATHKEYVLPRGECITSIVITSTGSSRSAQRLTLTDARRTFPITLSPDQSFTLSFGKGWHIDCTATICGELCNGDFEVWATTDNGPIALTACYR